VAGTGPVTPGLEILSPNETDQELYDRSPELLKRMTFWHLIGSIGPRGDTELRGFEDSVRGTRRGGGRAADRAAHTFGRTLRVALHRLRFIVGMLADRSLIVVP